LIIFFEQSGPAILTPPRRVKAIEVIPVHFQRRVYLFEIVHTLDAIGGFLRARECRQKHAGQNRNDRDDDQEFDQRECCSPPRSCCFISIQKKRVVKCSFHAFHFVFNFGTNFSATFTSTT